MEQLSPGATIIEPVLWSRESQLQKPSQVRAWAPKQEKTPQWEAWALKLESNLRSPQLERGPRSNEEPSPTNK